MGGRVCGCGDEYVVGGATGAAAPLVGFLLMPDGLCLDKPGLAASALLLAISRTLQVLLPCARPGLTWPVCCIPPSSSCQAGLSIFTCPDKGGCMLCDWLHRALDEGGLSDTHRDDVLHGRREWHTTWGRTVRCMLRWFQILTCRTLVQVLLYLYPENLVVIVIGRCVYVCFVFS